MTAHVHHESGTPRTALVTGATGGIGLELARLLATDGFHLILIGRRRDRLDQIVAELGKAHGIGVRVDSRDLSEDGTASRLWSDLASTGAKVDVLQQRRRGAVRPRRGAGSGRTDPNRMRSART